MLKVLVVDDEKLIRKGIINVMPWKTYGMEVVGEAANGRAAIEFMEINKVDLLMTDLSMPGLSGIEFIDEVINRFPKIKVVILTCHQSFDLIQAALRLGVIDYITKIQVEKDSADDVLSHIKKMMSIYTNESDNIDYLQPYIKTGKYSSIIMYGIHQVIDLIHRKYAENISIEDALILSHISRSYFFECFKAETGKTFIKYLRDYRMDKARELLIHTDKRINMIARECGYENEKYFSKLFQECTGMSPRAYRKASI